MERASQFQVTLDKKRRATFPAQLLGQAGVAEDAELIAHAEGAGRIVVETREAIRRRIRERAAVGRRRVGFRGSAADSLLADRESDASLE